MEIGHWLSGGGLVCFAAVVRFVSNLLFQQNSSRFGEIWASLARDYLAIMASSVSSERAFSSAGITITKRRNRLKGDIMEALQFLKSFYRHQSATTTTTGDTQSTISTLADGDNGMVSGDELEEDVDSIVFAATDDDDDILLCRI